MEMSEGSEKGERCMGQLRNCDLETQESVNEVNKMSAKIVKVGNYWKGTSQLIPNTFRLTSFLEEDLKNILEYQDLSRKEVLAQFYSRQSGSFEAEARSQSREGSCVVRKTPNLKVKSLLKSTFNK